MKEKKGFVTIGYGKRDMEQFIEILKRYKVNCIVDVRSSPYSKFSPDYNKGNLEVQFINNQISYKWLGHLIGGRSDDDLVFDKDGVIDYVKLVKTDPFVKGLALLEELILTSNVAIMCSEHNPLNCHRFLAISRELYKKQYIIAHITELNQYKSQANLEKDLKKLKFSDDFQLNMFNNEEDSLNLSYSMQNKKYGYKKKKEKSK